MQILEIENQFANSDLNANDHNKNFDLGQAAAKNDAYTSQADIVGDDCSDIIKQHITLTISMIS